MPDTVTPDMFHSRADDLTNTGWALTEDGSAIQKTFLFADFPDAMAFMLRVAFVAEAQCHHPNWCNVYNKVEVTLTTHDSGGLTSKDLGLARAMDAAL